MPENELLTSTGLFPLLDALYGMSGGENPGLLTFDASPARLVHDVSQGGYQAIVEGLTYDQTVLDVSGGAPVLEQPFSLDDKRMRCILAVVANFGAPCAAAATAGFHTSPDGGTTWVGMNPFHYKVAAAATAEYCWWVTNGVMGGTAPQYTEPMVARFVPATWGFRFQGYDATSPVGGTITFDLLYADVPSGAEVPSP